MWTACRSWLRLRAWLRALVWRNTVAEAAAAAAAALQAADCRVAAVVLSGQMQNLIPVADGRCLRPALLYSDTRAQASSPNERASSIVASLPAERGSG